VGKKKGGEVTSGGGHCPLRKKGADPGGHDGEKKKREKNSWKRWRDVLLSRAHKGKKVDQQL